MFAFDFTLWFGKLGVMVLEPMVLQSAVPTWEKKFPVPLDPNFDDAASRDRERSGTLAHGPTDYLERHVDNIGLACSNHVGNADPIKGGRGGLENPMKVGRLGPSWCMDLCGPHLRVIGSPLDQRRGRTTFKYSILTNVQVQQRDMVWLGQRLRSRPFRRDVYGAGIIGTYYMTVRRAGRQGEA
ncbi:hypothetical protein BD779DRAFT_1790767 [Infundibulicybe gibba]|nr:hypothetical protein BD779DRAFT_1790767 [Infundibulicybe gibba]